MSQNQEQFPDGSDSGHGDLPPNKKRKQVQPHHPQQPLLPVQQKEEPDDLDDDDSSDDKGDRKGRRKINIEFIEDKSRRHITFSKRKAGIMKKVRSCDPFCFPAVGPLGEGPRVP